MKTLKPHLGGAVLKQLSRFACLTSLAGLVVATHAQTVDITPLVHFPNGIVVKAEPGKAIKVKQGVPFGIEMLCAVEYKNYGYHPAAEFSIRPMVLSLGNTGFDLPGFIQENNYAPLPPLGRTVTALTDPQNGLGLKFLLGLGGSGPKLVGPTSYAKAIFNDQADGTWASKKNPGGVLPVGEVRLSWRRDLRDTAEAQRNAFGGLVISTYDAELVLDVEDDAQPEAIRLQTIESLTVRSADGRVTTDVPLGKFSPQQGEHLIGLRGSLLISGTLPSKTAYDIQLDGNQDVQTEVIETSNPVPNNRQNPTSVTVFFKAKFSGQTRLTAGEHRIKAQMKTPSGIALAKDVFPFTVQAPPPPPAPPAPKPAPAPAPVPSKPTPPLAPAPTKPAPAPKKPEPAKPAPKPAPAPKPGKK